MIRNQRNLCRFLDDAFFLPAKIKLVLGRILDLSKNLILDIFLDLRENVIAWALQDVDSDGDGRVSLVEFMADYMTKPTDGLEFYGDDHVEQEKDKFKEDFDINGDGYLEGEELSLWLGPDNTEIAIEEAG